MQLAPTWTEITVTPESTWKIIGNISTKPTIKFDSSYSINITLYYKKAFFKFKAKALNDIDLNNDKLNIILWIQQCTETSCLPPAEFNIPLSAELIAGIDENKDKEELTADDTVKQQTSNVTDSAQIAADNGSENPKIPEVEESKHELTESQLENSKMKKRGLLAYLWFAMLQGALALLTPCVFPMIPITVSFFTKRSEKEKSRGLLDSTVYALGIIFTFTGIGFIFALIYGPSGIQNLATNPWLNLAIATIFIVFAMNLFGAFEIQLPTGLMNKLNAKSQEGSGIMSVLLMGLTFSLTSFTCTVPFVGTTLVSVGSGEWFYPIVGMLAFSMVFAAPFFLLALFPSALNKMPKAGGWMNNIKVVMGFLEIAAAIKFISNADLVWMWGIMPREFFLAIWIAALIMIVLYILGIFKLPHDSPIDSIGTPRIVFSVFFLAITFYLFVGLMGKPLGELDAFLPPPNYEELMNPGSVSTASTMGIASLTSNGKKNTLLDELNWLNNYKEGLKLAKEQNKKLFIDFTGFTCTNCRWMELNMFSKSQIVNELKDMILVRLYTDRREEPYLSNKKFQRERFNSIELPLYVIYTPGEKLLGTKAFTRDIDNFLKFLQKK
jgi:thiol:disulfide interchange protein DsbD